MVGPMGSDAAPPPQSVRLRLAAVLLSGAAVTTALGVYAGVHPAAGQPWFTLGFSGMLQMKTWLATAAAFLLFLQLVSALWMWGRLPGAGRSPSWVRPLHRFSGAAAFALSLPVALHCLWALGFGSTSPRVVLHSTVACLFYGAYAAKMLALRLPGLPGWAIPVLGGSVLATLVLVWVTSALWVFTRSGLPLT